MRILEAKRLALVALLLASAVVTVVAQQGPDLTKTNPASIAFTYNLGPTGMRGWIYVPFPGGDAQYDISTQERMTAFPPYQILVTSVGTSTPASGILASNDVILGVSTGSNNVPVSVFTNDTRRSLGFAIGAAEAGDGWMNLKRWRAGVTNDVAIRLPLRGVAYSATAPYNCPKSTMILSNALLILQAQTLTADWKGAVSALALLSTGNTNYLPALRTLARLLADGSSALQTGRGLDTWNSGYSSVFLAEYYQATGDVYVLPGIHNYSVALSRSQSLYGTFGHKGSLLKSDGSYNGSMPWYGPVNSAGLVANLGIVLSRKAILASGGVVEPEIEPAIARAANFFSYYVGKGAIPYGEHATWPAHADNGKGGMAAVMFALMGDKPMQTEYYARLCLSSYLGEEYGHTGQGFAYLWTMLGANVGGDAAATAFQKEVSWHRDLTRRSDGSFVYDGAEQYGGSSVADYWSSSSYNGLSPTATYVLQLTLPLRNLYITGKNANPTNTLSASVVSNAIWAGRFSQECSGYATSNLLAAFGEYDTVVRDEAAVQVGTRTNEFSTLLPQLIVMAEGMTDARKRESACHALGYMGSTNALPALGRRLMDPEPWVRTRAAGALGQLGSTALPILNTMLTAFVTNATDPNVIVWDDPIQIANGNLSSVLFQTQPFRAQIRNQPAALFYAGLRAGLRQPDSAARGNLASLIQQDLNWNDILTLAPDLVGAVKERAPADQMFAEGIRYAGLKTFGKFKVEEGIPLCLMVKEQNWHSDDWEPFQVLRDIYGTAAAEVLPTLYDWQNHLPAFDADPSIPADRYTNIAFYINTTIAALEAATPAAPLSYFKTVNIGSTMPLDVNRVQLVGTAADQDGGVPRYSWSKVSGQGNVSFSTNHTPAGASVLATFETPGVYVVQLGVADSSILDSGVWTKPVLGYYDFQTYNHDYGLAFTNRTIVISRGTNWPPVAYAQAVVTGVGAARSVTLRGFDYDGDALTYSVVTLPAHGNFSGTLPNVTYTPVAGYLGSDAFTFKVTDSRGLSSPVATVSIDVRNSLAINVNFNGWTGGSSGTTEVESTLVGPAGGIGTRWNQLTNASSVGTLLDTNGTTTSVAFATTASEGRAWGNPTLKLLHSAATHFSKGQDMTLTISGLTPASQYNVWLASHANNSTLVERARGTWSTTNSTTSPSAQVIDGVTILNGATWQSGSNYVQFANVVADGAGKIVFLGDAADVGDFDTNAYRLPLNGFQIVQQPPITPAPPSGLSAAPGDGQVALTWNAVSGARGYLVKRSSTPGGPYTTRANPGATYFMDAPATNGQTWYYVVSAVDGYGEGAYSPEVSATPVQLIPPVAPTNLVAAAGVGVVDLTWNASATAFSYIIKRGIHPGGPYLALATLDTTNYHDAAVLNNMNWYYVVSAANMTGEGTNSVEVAALPRSISRIINVNFYNTTGTPTPEVEATLFGVFGPGGGLATTWNQFNVDSASSLKDSTGATTSIGYLLGNYGNGWLWGTPALHMLHGGRARFNVDSNQLHTFTINGLVPGMDYNVWIASANCLSSQQSAGTWSTTNTTASPSSQFVSNVGAINDLTWQLGNNSALFEHVVADGAGKIAFRAQDGTVGAATYRFPLSGFQFSILGTNPPPPFLVWAADPVQGLASGVNDGPGDDPDGDGIPNLLEFVLGGNPLQSSNGMLPTLKHAFTGWVYEYDRSDVSVPPATTQVVEYSTDLVTWTSVIIPANSAGAVTITPGSPSDHVSVALPNLGRAGFVRLKVLE